MIELKNKRKELNEIIEKNSKLNKDKKYSE